MFVLTALLPQWACASTTDSDNLSVLRCNSPWGWDFYFSGACPVALFFFIQPFVLTLDAGYGCKAGAGLLEFLGLGASRFWDGTEGEGGTVAGSDAEVAGA